MTLPDRPSAAVSLVERDNVLLCVWNARYHGWTFPGGKVEAGETIETAQARELEEETGLRTVLAKLVYDAPTCVDGPEDRGRHVYLFRVEAEGQPRQMEEQCQIIWMPQKQFLMCSPFTVFYRAALAAIVLSGSA